MGSNHFLEGDLFLNIFCAPLPRFYKTKKKIIIFLEILVLKVCDDVNTFAWGENTGYFILLKILQLPFVNNDLPFYVGSRKYIS